MYVVMSRTDGQTPYHIITALCIKVQCGSEVLYTFVTIQYA